jgi:hypothetical protein
LLYNRNSLKHCSLFGQLCAFRSPQSAPPPHFLLSLDRFGRRQRLYPAFIRKHVQLGECLLAEQPGIPRSLLYGPIFGSNAHLAIFIAPQARVLCPQYAAKDYHRFLVGTCSLHDSNEMSILQYFEDSNHFDVSCSFAHPDQIWAIEASPKDSALVVTSRQSLGARSLTLWRMPQQDAESLAADPAGGDSFHNEQLELTEIASFCHTQKAVSVRDIKWSSTEDTLLTINNKMLSTWTIGEGSISVSSAVCIGVALNMFSLSLLYIIHIYSSTMDWPWMTRAKAFYRRGVWPGIPTTPSSAQWVWAGLYASWTRARWR